MITIRLTDCVDCSTITSLLNDIDCKLTELAKILYNNTIFALNQPVQSSVFLDLLNYKRILTYRTCNADYALPYTTEMIASKVKILKYK
jgi:hypothetical protein